MKLTIARGTLLTVTTDLVAVCCTTPSKDRKDTIADLNRTDGGVEIDQALGGLLTQIIRNEALRGDLGQYRVIPTMGKIPARAVVLLGTGTAADYSLETARRIQPRVKGTGQTLAFREPHKMTHTVFPGHLRGAIRASVVNN